MTFTEFQKFAHNTFNSICPKIEEKNVCNGISESYVDQFVTHYYKYISLIKFLINLKACIRPINKLC